MSGFSDSMKSADKVDISLGPVQQKIKQPTYTLKCSTNDEESIIISGLSYDTVCDYLKLEVERFTAKLACWQVWIGEQSNTLQITIEEERA